MLGACLGAQLLAHALGGRVRRRPWRLVAGVALEALPAAQGAADAGHLAGQRGLSEALFGGFARVVDALRRDDRARSASPGGR